MTSPLRADWAEVPGTLLESAPDVLTPAQVARRCGLSPRAFYRAYRDGRFPAWFAPVPWTDHLRWRTVDVDRLLCAHALQSRTGRRRVPVNRVAKGTARATEQG